MRKRLIIALPLALMSILLISCELQPNVHQSIVFNYSEKDKPNILNMIGLEINSEQYGGIYIEDGIYHINLVGSTDDFQDKVKLDNVSFHSVNYSLKYLNSVAKVLTDNMLNLDISVITTDEKDNKVYIYIKDIDDSKIEGIKKVIDSPVIVAREQVLNIQFS